MKQTGFSHVRHWVFDLDHTLYPPEARLFDQIERKMTAWMVRELALERAEADRLRLDYWDRYGSSLVGLIAEHGIEPEGHLAEVHDITLDHLQPDPELAEAIGALPGRRIVFTNGGRDYANRVLGARGLAGVFDAVYGVAETRYQPKPREEAFRAVFAADGTDPACGAMFEDDPRNLAVPARLGMRCVLVGPEAGRTEHCHHVTEDLCGFLRGDLGLPAPAAALCPPAEAG